MSKKTQNDIQEPNAPRNDFLPFAATSTANVLDQASYQTLEARTNGFVSGVAKSLHLNKVWRQGSIMAASLAQYIVNRTGHDVVDDGDIQKLAGLIEMAVKKTSGLGVPMGGIIAWSGAKAAIPAGFSLCDGNNGTPNLVGRFVLGGDEHGGAGGSAKISIEQMPAHSHTGSTAGAGGHTHGGSAAASGNHSHGGSTAGAGGHSHGVSDGNHSHTTTLNAYGSGGSDHCWAAWTGRDSAYLGQAAAGTSGSGAGVSIQAVGDHAHGLSIAENGTHSHGLSIDAVGDHSHNVSLNNTGGGADYLPPYFQLCYIMRTSEE